MHRVDDSRGFGATFERILPLLLTVLGGLKDPAAGAGLGLGFLESRDLQPDRFQRQQQIDIQRQSEQQQAALTSARIQKDFPKRMKPLMLRPYWISCVLQRRKPRCDQDQPERNAKKHYREKRRRHRFLSACDVPVFAGHVSCYP